MSCVISVILGFALIASSVTSQPPDYSGYVPAAQYGQPQQATNDYVYQGHVGSAGQVNNYGNAQPSRIEPSLDQLFSYIDNLQSRQRTHGQVLQTLVRDANRNLDFQLASDTKIAPDFSARHAIRVGRLDALEAKVAEIAALREQVATLQMQADSLQADVENNVYPARQQIASDLTALRDSDLARADRILETNTRDMNIADRLDELLLNALDNLRALDVLKQSVVVATLSMNRQKVVIPAMVTFEPTRELQTYSKGFRSSDGVSQFALVTLQGFSLERNGYTNGLQSWYIDSAADIWNDRLDIRYQEMSGGGWVASSITLNKAFVFLDINTPWS